MRMRASDGPIKAAVWIAGWTALLILLPDLALAQADPFARGATSFQSTLLAWGTPAAAIIIMIAGGFAMAGRLSWGWVIGLILGIAIFFGAPQILAWIRGMFGT